MTQIKKYEHAFEGQKLTTILYQGRPCWSAHDIAHAIGYQDPSRFADKMGGQWSEDFIEGTDYDVLRGSSLRNFKRLYSLATDSGVSGGHHSSDVLSKRAPSLVVLYESGVHMALVKTAKPKGRRLRRVLAEQVLPQLTREGRYDPSRLAMDGELEDRERHGSWLRWLYGELKKQGVDTRALATLAVTAAEVSTGQDLAWLKRAPILNSPIPDRDTDVVGQFLAERCVLLPHTRVKAGALYDAHVAWCREQGVSPVDRRWLGRALKGRGFRAAKSHGTRWYHGVQLAA